MMRDSFYGDHCVTVLDITANHILVADLPKAAAVPTADFLNYAAAASSSADRFNNALLLWGCPAPAGQGWLCDLPARIRVNL